VADQLTLADRRLVLAALERITDELAQIATWLTGLDQDRAAVELEAAWPRGRARLAGSVSQTASRACHSPTRAERRLTRQISRPGRHLNGSRRPVWGVCAGQQPALPDVPHLTGTFGHLTSPASAASR
jgi:hypothetical protein